MQVKFTLLKCDPAKTREVADRIVQLPESTEVYTIIGEYDLLIKFRVPDGSNGIDEFEKFLDERVRCIDGLVATNTLVTQRWFS